MGEFDPKVEIPRTGVVYPAPERTELPQAKFRDPPGGPAEPSLGMKRVRASFNPSGNHDVDALKTISAHLIDYCESLKTRGPNPPSGEAARLWSLAQTAFEKGCMWAVKAATE